MVLGRFNIAVVAALVALSTGCLLGKKREQPKGPKIPVTVVLAHKSGASSKNLAASPKQFASDLESALRRSGFEPTLRDASAVPEVLEVQSSGARMDRLRERFPDQAVFLVETRTVFYTEFRGRFRWTIAVKVSTADAAGKRPKETALFTVPAILNFPHHGVPEALSYAAVPIANEVAAVGARLRDGTKKRRVVPNSAAPVPGAPVVPTKKSDDSEEKDEPAPEPEPKPTPVPEPAETPEAPPESP